MSELENLDDFWATTRATIEQEYRFGTKDNYCRVVAEHIAEILHANGQEPSIVRLEHPHMLIPLIYERRIRWEWHEICIARDLAYDPIHELPPMTLEDYITGTFLKSEYIKVNYRAYEPST